MSLFKSPRGEIVNNSAPSASQVAASVATPDQQQHLLGRNSQNLAFSNGKNAAAATTSGNQSATKGVATTKSDGDDLI